MSILTDKSEPFSSKTRNAASLIAALFSASTLSASSFVLQPRVSSSTVGSVELVSNATNTSTNVINSFKEALSAVWELEGLGDAGEATEPAAVDNTPRIVGIVIAVLAILSVGGYIAYGIIKRRKQA